ncbi:hypothetical protein ScPMuIL_000346 [Solemya velum]
MATIVRVKRRRNEEPAEILLVSCKKTKNEEGTVTSADAKESQDFLKFAGTLTTKNDCISKPVREAIKKDKLQKEYKRHNCTVFEEKRQQKRKSSADNRYRITSKHRTLAIEKLDDISLPEECISNEQRGDKCTGNPNQSSELVDNKVFRLFDVEKDCVSEVGNTMKEVTEKAAQDTSQITCNSVQMVREKSCSTHSAELDYVYDLYYTNSHDFNFRLIEDMLTVEAFSDEFLYDNGASSDEEYLEGSDDSNSESNWRNDYPDEDPHFFENNTAAGYSNSFNPYENEMAFGIDGPLSEYMSSRCNIEDEEEAELSTDEEVEDCIGLTSGSSQVSYKSFLKRVTEEFQDYKTAKKDEDDG